MEQYALPLTNSSLSFSLFLRIVLSLFSPSTIFLSLFLIARIEETQFQSIKFLTTFETILENEIRRSFEY